MFRLVSILMALLVSNEALSQQKIYKSDYNIKYSIIKNFNETKGTRVFSQLTLNQDNTYSLEGYSYKYVDKKKSIINCSKYSGIWKKSGDLIILETNVVTIGEKIAVYKLTKRGHLILIGQKNKQNSRKTKFVEAESKDIIICPNIKDCLNNDLN